MAKEKVKESKKVKRVKKKAPNKKEKKVSEEKKAYEPPAKGRSTTYSCLHSTARTAGIAQYSCKYSTVKTGGTRCSTVKKG